MKTIEKLEKQFKYLCLVKPVMPHDELQFWNDVNDAIRLGKRKNGALNQGTSKDIFIEFVRLITSAIENFEVINSTEDGNEGPDTGNYIHFFNVHTSDRGMSLSALEKIKRFCDAKDIFISGGNLDPWVITYEVIY